eukprot:scaffold84763_cov31-Tisochrysis_lutea.AAC.2
MSIPCLHVVHMWAKAAAAPRCSSRARGDDYEALTSAAAHDSFHMRRSGSRSSMTTSASPAAS